MNALDWLEPDALAACVFPDAERGLPALARLGVAVVVNLHERAHDPAVLEHHGIVEVHLPVPDFTPPTPAQLQAGVTAITDALAAGTRVAVHCHGGLGRTGTLLACYLVSTGMAALPAIDRVRQARPGSVETPDQELAVIEYAAAGEASLAGGGVLLRRVEARDTADRLAAGRDAEAVRMYGGDDRHLAPFTSMDAERWYRRIGGDPHAWVMEVDGRCIGSVALHDVSARERRARVTIEIHDPAMRNRGIGTEAMRLMLRYAFERLGLHRVGLRVLEYNTRAIASYEKCGFIREGVERETVPRDGVWYSDVMMGILDREYRALAARWPGP